MIALFGGDFVSKWRFFLHNKTYLALTGIFFVLTFSGLYSEWTAYFWDRVRVALPFLVLPFAFSSLPKLSERQFNLLHYALLVAVTVVSIGTFGYYLSNYKFLNAQLEHGRPIPTPIHHIRFSLLIAYTIVVGCWLLLKKITFRYAWERSAIAAMTLFLFVWLHILSVRSGILVLYVVLFLLSVQQILSTRNYALGAGVLLLIAAAPFVAYQTMGSFKSRIDYAVHDFRSAQAGKVKNFSDGERLISLKIGWAIGNKNPLFGVGIGDLDTEITKAYHTEYPDFVVKRPHNQFLFFYAARGLLGVAWFCWAFFFPFFYKKNYKDPLFLGFYSIIFLSFMVENTIGTAVGTAFFLYFVLIELKRLEN